MVQSSSSINLNDSAYVAEQVKHLKNLKILEEFKNSNTAQASLSHDVFELVKTTESLYKLLDRTKSLPRSERADSIIAILELQLGIPLCDLVSPMASRLKELESNICSKEHELEGLDLEIRDKSVLISKLKAELYCAQYELDEMKGHSISLSTEPNCDLVDHHSIVSHPNKEQHHDSKSYIKWLFKQVRKFFRYSS